MNTSNSFNLDYSFFDLLNNFEEKFTKLYKPPYSLNIKLRNYNDNISVELDTDKVSSLEELPQNINEIVNMYPLVQHCISCYDDTFWTHFDVKIIANNHSYKLFFSIKGSELKQMITNKNI
jgi:hypothetical protein